MYLVFVSAVQVALKFLFTAPNVDGTVLSQELNEYPIRDGFVMLTVAPNLPLTVCDVLPSLQLPSLALKV